MDVPNIPPKSEIRPRYSIENTFSGQAAELSVAALLVRAGFRVAQPLWSNDYTDLLILKKSKGWLVPIPVQVKSVQQAGKTKSQVAIQGLKKKYVKDVPALCLAIYSPAHDKIWFIPGAENIRIVHQNWVEKSNASPGTRAKLYEDILPENDIPIRVDLSTSGDAEFDEQWLVDRKSPIDLYNQINQLAEGFVTRLKKIDSYSETLTKLLLGPIEDNTEKSDEFSEDG